jgi:hypothetical protein
MLHSGAMEARVTGYLLLNSLILLRLQAIGSLIGDAGRFLGEESRGIVGWCCTMPP